MILNPFPMNTAVDTNGVKIAWPWLLCLQSIYAAVFAFVKYNTGVQGYTVSTLPAAGVLGRRTWVTDATAPTFLGTLTGGGSVKTPVFDNGIAWVAG